MNHKAVCPERRDKGRKLCANMSTCSQLTAEMEQMARLAAKTGFSLTPMTLKTAALSSSKHLKLLIGHKRRFINKNANYVKCHTKIELVVLYYPL